MVLAEPKTIHSLKELENKLSAPTGDPDKNAYRYNSSGKGFESYDLKIFLFSHNTCNFGCDIRNFGLDMVPSV